MCTNVFVSVRVYICVIVCLSVCLSVSSSPPGAPAAAAGRSLGEGEVREGDGNWGIRFTIIQFSFQLWTIGYLLTQSHLIFSKKKTIVSKKYKYCYKLACQNSIFHLKYGLLGTFRIEIFRSIRIYHYLIKKILACFFLFWLIFFSNLAVLLDYSWYLKKLLTDC